MPGLLSLVETAQNDTPSPLSQFRLDDADLDFYQQSTGTEDQLALASAIIATRYQVPQVSHTSRSEDFWLTFEV